MSKFWSDSIKSLKPYVPGEQPKDKKYIKLNTNENPYPPSQAAIEAIKLAANEGLRLYPDPGCSSLKNAIAGYFGLESNMIFIGNGSDEILAFCWKAFFDNGGEVLFPDITYSFYPVYSEHYGVKHRTVPLNEDFTVPVEFFFKSSGGVVITNPNAPTGLCLSLPDIERIVEGNPDNVVILDEAYIDFGGESAVGLINKYENLLVVRTFSKSHSLAGLRVGYAMGQRHLIEGLERVRDSFNSYTVDALALAGAEAAFRDIEYFRKTVSRVVRTRDDFSLNLRQLGFTVHESKANFVFVSHPNNPAEHLFTKLKENGILVRYFNKPRISNYLRISIGTDEQMQELVQELSNNRRD
ncbi:MAG: histidinol-phosphate transaminase [Eubacteriales bacterium]|nr:histidinol-phosphate transaminase [Eubacteriales bacterium]